MEKYKVIANLIISNKLEVEVMANDIDEATILALQQAKREDWTRYKTLQTKAF